MTRIRPLRPLLALALIPAAGGIALASAGSFAAAAPADPPTTSVQLVSSTAPTRIADDHGGNRPKPRPSRTPEAGDDSGGHGGRTTTRAPEAGDDRGGSRSVSSATGAIGTGTSRTVTVRAAAPSRVADDHGGERPKPRPTRTTEAGDDSGGHGSGGHHGGADDGPNHS